MLYTYTFNKQYIYIYLYWLVRKKKKELYKRMKFDRVCIEARLQ